MLKLLQIPILIIGLVLISSCSNSNCKDFEATLRNLETSYVNADRAARSKPQTSETWIPVIQAGLVYTNYALNNPKCVSPEGLAMWQTMKQTFSASLDSWTK